MKFYFAIITLPLPPPDGSLSPNCSPVIVDVRPLGIGCGEPPFAGGVALFCDLQSPPPKQVIVPDAIIPESLFCALSGGVVCGASQPSFAVASYWRIFAARSVSSSIVIPPVTVNPAQIVLICFSRAILCSTKLAACSQSFASALHSSSSLACLRTKLICPFRSLHLFYYGLARLAVLGSRINNGKPKT
jgi:hypothetical protein